MSYNSQVAVSNVPTNTSAETLIATSSPVSVNNPGGQGNDVYGVVNVTAGASTTAIVVRVRSSAGGVGLAGTNLGPAAGFTHTLAAGASASIPFEVNDPSNQAVGVQYTVSVAQTGGTVAGTVNYACIGVNPATGAS
jgi:hypothetical protein